MAMKPKERYQSVSEMSHDLKLVLSSLLTSMQLPSTFSARPIDPHSTQPDLPQLFENMQNNQAGKDQSSRDSSPVNPLQQPQPSQISSIQTHCPRCNAELRRQAAFCPQCGLSLPKNPPDNPLSSTTPVQSPKQPNPNVASSRQADTKMQPENQVDTSMSASPHSSGTSSNSTRQQGLNGSTMAVDSNPSQNMLRTQMQSSAQKKVFSPAPSQVPPKSFIQTSMPTLVQAVPATQVPITVPTTQSASQTTSTGSRKILLYMAIAFIVILLIVMFVVLQSFVAHT
jgi:hypothetical protein